MIVLLFWPPALPEQHGAQLSVLGCVGMGEARGPGSASFRV